MVLQVKSGSTVDTNQFGCLITTHMFSDFLVDVSTSFLL